MEKMLRHWFSWADARMERTPHFWKWKYEFRGHTLKTVELIDVIREALGWYYYAYICDNESASELRWRLGNIGLMHPWAT